MQEMMRFATAGFEGQSYSPNVSSELLPQSPCANLGHVAAQANLELRVLEQYSATLPRHSLHLQRKRSHAAVTCALLLLAAVSIRPLFRWTGDGSDGGQSRCS